MKKTIQNERGFVLITSMMMLVVLMVIGIAATNTTTIELQISGNDKAAKMNFYEAEATAYEGARWLKEEYVSAENYGFMETTTANRQVNELSTFIDAQQDELNDPATGIRVPSTWDSSNIATGSIDINTTSYRIMGLGISEGSTLSLNNAAVPIRHKYAVIGRYDNDTGGRRGNVMVEMGVRF